MKIINLFYQEPDPDRWFKYDRYIRSVVRRIVRGRPKVGGVMMVALELMKGLDLLKIPYRFNDYKYAKKNPRELIGVIGKPHVIFEKRFKNPILFGAGVYSHPIDCLNLFEDYPNVKKILVPGQWMREMFEPYYLNKVTAWPVGIDTEKWSEKIKDENLIYDFLIYDKIRWEHSKYEVDLLSPIINELTSNGFTYHIIRYGHYVPNDLLKKICVSKSVIFLCEHETQGIAYQQILSTNTPIFAWDRGGYWQDPFYYPDRVKYQSVSSVPYWDDRCGLKFNDFNDFKVNLKSFYNKLNSNKFSPRAYIMENLTLQKCALEYAEIYKNLAQSISND